MALVYVGIGANGDDGRAFLGAALDGIALLGTIISGAPIYETCSERVHGKRPHLSTVIALDTTLRSVGLYEKLRTIEQECGQGREIRPGTRSLALEVVWYPGVVAGGHAVAISSREIRRRRSILAPLADLDPSLGDDAGPFTDALRDVSDQPIMRITGPLDIAENRWIVGIHDAIHLGENCEGRRSFVSHPDWANSSEDMFGAYLTAVSLFVVRDEAPGMAPIALTHRFTHGVRAGAVGDAALTVSRRTDRSLDATVVLSVDGRGVGRTTISLVTALPDITHAPQAPTVSGMATTRPLVKLARAMGVDVGRSALNWGPLEDWKNPGLDDRNGDTLRLWSPNVAVGRADPYLSAAAMLMPIDAAIWPATMNTMGSLPDGPAISTPTIELTARFADLTDADLYHLVEASIDHRTQSSVAGTVRVWGSNGGYRAIGHSQNLIRHRPPDQSP